MEQVFKRVMCLILTLVMVAGMLPMSAISAEAEETTEIVEETTEAATEETTEPETGAPAESTPEESVPEETAPEETAPEETEPEETTLPPETEADPEDVTSPQEQVSEAAVAEALEIGGVCGENLTWSLNENSVLTISGTGAMDDYGPDPDNPNGESTAPWHDKIFTAVIVEDGVSTLGDYAFFSMWDLKKVTIADSVTAIGDYCFASCMNLKSIEIPAGVKYLGDYCFDCGFGLTEVILHDGLETLGEACFANCTALTEITLPNSVTSIGADCFLYNTSLTKAVLSNRLEELPDNCFWICKKLAGIEIPDSVIRIGYNCFSGCELLEEITIPAYVESLGALCFSAKNLKKVTFRGDAPVFELAMGEAKPWSQFTGVTADVYYPAGNETWTEDKRSDYGGNLTWIAAEFEEAPGVQPCSLAELTDIDYLAFSQLAYTAASKATTGMTVRKLVGKKWTKTYKNTGIRYAELFSHIKNWEVYSAAEDPSTGFGAYTFTNNQGEYVISFRGTNGELIDFAEDVHMSFGWNGKQIDNALNYARGIIAEAGNNAVAITGHSLGGGLCDIVSARFDCKAVSFNAAPFIANAYYYRPEHMGERFSGTENWRFTDHITRGDSFVGETTKEIKNYILHECAQASTVISSGSVFGPHYLDSMLQKTELGEIALTTALGRQKIVESVFVKAGLLNLLTHIYLGTSGSDTFTNKTDIAPLTAFGGDDQDLLTLGWLGDVLVGGRGDDILTGKRGSDEYHYFKGDGLDTIRDSGGGSSGDTLLLHNFDETDRILVEKQGSFVTVLCNGEKIIQIFQNRESLNKTFWLQVDGREKQDITSFFNGNISCNPMIIACPVNVEIVEDATGDVVYTLENAQSSLGTHDTDYGYFYVYQDESGEYVKEAELIDGYSLRIIGVDSGSMNVTVLLLENDDSYNFLRATEIPVTDTLCATVEETEAGMVLLMDNDGDGAVDGEVSLKEGYGVTFRWGEGLDDTEARAAVNQPVEAPESISREGNTVTGWYLEPELVTAWDFSQPVTQDMILYAKWLPNVLDKTNQDTEINIEIRNPESLIYTGKPIKPEIIVRDGGKILVAGTDYTVTYKNNTNACDHTDASIKASKLPQILVQGKGNYKNAKKITVPFTIYPVNLADLSVKVPAVVGVKEKDKRQTLTAEVRTEAAKVSAKAYTLRYFTDEELANEVSGLTAAGTYYVVVEAVEGGNLRGATGAIPVVVVPKSQMLSSAKLTAQKNIQATADILEEKAAIQAVLSKLVVNKVTYLTDDDNIAEFMELFAVTARDTDGKAVELGKVLNSAGKKTITVTAREGNAALLAGEKSLTITVKGIPLSKKQFTLENLKLEYTGEAQQPAITTELVPGTDYTVSFLKGKTGVKEPIDAGSYSLVITGQGLYSGKLTYKLTIASLDLNKAFEAGLLSIAHAGTAVYSPSKAQVPVSLAYNGQALAEGEDYTLKFSGNTKVTDSASFTIAGKGNFKGTLKGLPELTYAITPKAISSKDVVVNVTGMTIKKGVVTAVKFTLKDSGKTVSAKEYVSEIQELEDQVQLTITGADKNYTGTRTLLLDKILIKTNSKQVKIARTDKDKLYYTGSPIRPAITITDTEGNDISDCFTVTYGENTNVGIGTITITGNPEMGYYGAKTLKFTILPKWLKWLFG